MPDEQQPTIHDPAVQEPQTPAYEPIEDEEQDEWLEQPEDLELPARPRRRLLTPIPLALLGALLIAGGFIAGVQVQKGQTSSSSASGAPAGLASGFAGLRGGTSSTGTSSTKASTGSAAGGFPGTGAGGSRPTIGTVAYLAGNTLYVTNSEGNTIKVHTSPATSVTKTVKTKVKGVYPGETVTVTGATGSNGEVSAESISVGSSGSALAALLGGSGTSSSSSTSKNSGSKSSGSGSAALFGSG
jgi:hypothetical protein